MAGLLDLLGGALGDDATTQISQKIGANPQATSAAITAALPMLVSALSHNAGKPGGAESLMNALQRDQHGSLLDNVTGFLGGASGGNAANGAGILGHLLGDRQQPAEHAVAKTSGLDRAQVAQLLVLLAPLVMGAVSRMQKSKSLDASGLGSMLNGERASIASSHPDLASMATQLLDKNHDGSMVDDIVGGLGKMFGGR